MDFFNFVRIICLDFFNFYSFMTYLPRLIDSYLKDWAISPTRKPLLLRGARQVGKSRSVRHLGEDFKYFTEVNFEKNPEYKTIFKGNLNIERIISQLSIIVGTEIVDGDTLLFLDEIQECPEAIMSLRFFKEDRPGLHVIAAGSLLEFALADLPTFGVGRIHSMFMYPMTFDEFLTANGERRLMDARNTSGPDSPLPDIFADKLTELFRIYILVGGMPEVVASWVSVGNFQQCQQLQDDLINGYTADFAKYKKKANPELLRAVFNSAALQLTKKFTFSEVPGSYKTNEVKNALELLTMAGLLTPVTRTDANGLPLGGEANPAYRKYLTLDSGLTLRMLSLILGTNGLYESSVLTQTAADLVNKGPMAELIAGLELIRYQVPNLKHELYYWTRQQKNSLAEVDYVINSHSDVVPIEVKAGRQGGMKSLWCFMRLKSIHTAVRSSLENFGRFEYIDREDGDARRQVVICPLYGLSMLPRLLTKS